MQILEKILAALPISQHQMLWKN